MLEPIGTTAAIITFVEKTIQICKAFNDITREIRDGPKHVRLIARELEDFYLVVATLESLLEAAQTRAGVSHVARIVADTLDSCIPVFKEIAPILHDFDPRTGEKGRWRRWRWTWKAKEVDVLRNHLVASKMNLNMAISVANMHKLDNLHDATERMEFDTSILPNVSRRLEDMMSKDLPAGQSPSEQDRGALAVDLSLPLRRYIGDADSIISECSRPSSPSAQVSSFQSSRIDFSQTSRKDSVYSTAPSHQSKAANVLVLAEDSMIINLRGVDSPTVAVQVQSDFTLDDIVSFLYYQYGIPTTTCEIRSKSRVLGIEPGIGTLTLQQLNIQPDTILLYSDTGPGNRLKSRKIRLTVVFGDLQPARLHVNTRDSDYVALDITTDVVVNETFWKIMKNIEQEFREDESFREYGLCYDCTVLEPTKSPQDYGITQDSTIQLIKMQEYETLPWEGWEEVWAMFDQYSSWVHQDVDVEESQVPTIATQAGAITPIQPNRGVRALQKTESKPRALRTCNSTSQLRQSFL